MPCRSFANVFSKMGCSPTNNQQPTTNNQQQTTNNQQQITNNQQPTTNNQQPTTNNQQPTTNNNLKTHMNARIELGLYWLTTLEVLFNNYRHISWLNPAVPSLFW
ncbi:MAG: hypothetical protein F6K47_29175 [Symploca sp. SIO2E6]|nr:hypothetical protein [Symploca sp. SIO2E6]